MSKEQRQSSKLLEPRSFNVHKKAAAPMITMLGHLEIDIEILDADMETAESNEVLKDALVFLIEVYFKPVLGYFYEIGHCKVDFCNVHIKLHWISMEMEVILKWEIIKLIRLSAAEDIRDMSFCSPWVSIRTESLISIKSISKLTKYIGQLFISIIALTVF